jgi:elongation factor P
MAQYDTTQFRKGLKFEINGEPYIMLESQFVKPGKGAAVYKTRIKSLISGNVLDRTYRSGDRVDAANVEDREMQFLYKDEGAHHLMDTQSYEQFSIPNEVMADAALYMQENISVKVLLHNGRPIGVEPPNFVVLEVVETDPGVRGDTVTGGTKPAKMTTGAVIQVPLFVETGQRIKIDTRTGQYVERA